MTNEDFISRVNSFIYCGVDTSKVKSPETQRLLEIVKSAYIEDRNFTLVSYWVTALSLYDKSPDILDKFESMTSKEVSDYLIEAYVRMRGVDIEELIKKYCGVSEI